MKSVAAVVQLGKTIMLKVVFNNISIWAIIQRDWRTVPFQCPAPTQNVQKISRNHNDHANMIFVTIDVRAKMVTPACLLHLTTKKKDGQFSFSLVQLLLLIFIRVEFTQKWKEPSHSWKFWKKNHPENRYDFHE